MNSIKKLFTLIIAALLLTPSFSNEITVECWRPYTPPFEAFNVSNVDYVNEPVIYANRFITKDGYYYVGIYEGLTRSASLIRVTDKETADELLARTTEYFKEYIELVSKIRAYIKYKKYHTETVEENLSAATKNTYMDATRRIIDWIDTKAEIEEVQLELPVNGQEDKTVLAVCVVSTNYQSYLNRLKTEFEENLPNLRDEYKDYL